MTTKQKQLITTSLLILGALLLAIQSIHVFIVILAILLLVIVHEAGHFLFAKASGMAVTEFYAGFGREVFGFTKGETRYGLKLLPLGGYVKIVGMSSDEKVEARFEGRAYRDASWIKKTASVLAGPGMNIVAAIVLFFIMYSVVGISQVTTTIDEVSENSPAVVAGVSEKDRIIAINGQNITEWSQVAEALAASTGEVMLTVERRGEEKSFQVLPTEDNGRKILGVRAATERVQVGVIEGLGNSFNNTWEASYLTVKAIPSLLGNLAASFENPENPNRPVSIVGAVQLSEEASTIGLEVLLPMIAVISISLAIFNLLPIPPLDGGHIALATCEAVLSKIKKRKVAINPRIFQGVALVGLVLLLTVGAAAIFLDLTNPVTENL